MIKINIRKYLGALLNFFRDVVLQMKRITWPTFKESLKYTIIIIISSILIAVFLGGVDFGLTTLLNKFILK